jgi:hypothetical protein
MARAWGGLTGESAGRYSASMTDRPEQPVPRALDVDLHCLTCGYNLRGLAGDPIRCPECGSLNPVGDVEIPAPVISAQLRRMETGPAICVAAALFGVPLLTAFVSTLCFRPSAAPAAFVSCLTVSLLLALIAWLVGVWRFRSSCLGRPGWLGALLRYHLWGSLWSGLVAGVMGGGAVLLWPLKIGLYGAPSNGLFLGGMLVLFIVTVLCARIGLKRLHARFMSGTHALQREVAVTIAREEGRKRLAAALSGTGKLPRAGDT